MHVNNMHYMYRQVVMHLLPYDSTRWPVMPKPVCGSVFGEIINNSKFARVLLLVLTKLCLFGVCVQITAPIGRDTEDHTGIELVILTIPGKAQEATRAPTEPGQKGEGAFQTTLWC